MRRRLDFQKTSQSSFGDLIWTLTTARFGSFAHAKQQKWVVSIFHFADDGAVFVQLCPVYPSRGKLPPEKNCCQNTLKSVRLAPAS